jgi:hypothetical protein
MINKRGQGAWYAWLVVGFCILLALVARHSPVLAQSSSDPLVLAFYYTWYDENTWTPAQLSDLPAQPYVSRDRGVMARHIDQAKAAGIDALIVAWYGPGGDNQTESNLSGMLDEAAARGFRIGILLETDSPFLGSSDAVSGALQHALSAHANQAAYLRVDGRPVIFFWHPTIYGVETWRAIRNQVDPNHSSIWIAEGIDMSYQAVFDGHYLYSNTWNPPNDLTYTNQKFARWVETARQQQGAYKFWVATVMPGYNDIRIRPNSGFVQDREGGGYYARAWQAAIASQPNWVVITSFNEWPEGTYIEPSQAYGDQYLGLTAQWSQQFKAGGGVVVAAGALPPITAPSPTATPQPEPSQPTAFVQVDLLNLRAGPGTDFAIVGTANLNSALVIVGRNPEYADWWQVRSGDQVAWVFAQMVRAAGPLDQVGTAEAPSLQSATASRTSHPKPIYDPQNITLKPYLSPGP